MQLSSSRVQSLDWLFSVPAHFVVRLERYRTGARSAATANDSCTMPRNPKSTPGEKDESDHLAYSSFRCQHTDLPSQHTDPHFFTRPTLSLLVPSLSFPRWTAT